MNTILDKIVDSKKREIERCRTQVPQSALEAGLSTAPAVRNFFDALSDTPGIAVIAEVKKASPSAGVLRSDFDPVAIAKIYADNGAAALSVLTDVPFFQGHLDYLAAVRRSVAPPVLRKDFIIDDYQVIEARAAGADALLLIAEILDDAALARLLKLTRRLGMEALVELYEPNNLPRVLNAGARLIGVNNRNLRTFSTRLEHTLDLAPRIPSDCILVSESGIRTRADIELLQSADVKAVLIGETLMRAADIGAKLRELRGQ